MSINVVRMQISITKQRPQQHATQHSKKQEKVFNSQSNSLIFFKLKKYEVFIGQNSAKTPCEHKKCFCAQGVFKPP